MLRAAAVFSDHMVLQRNKIIRIFGQGVTGREIRVTLGEDRARTLCRQGKWTVCLPEREDAIEAGSGEYVYEYGTETSLRELRFTLDSTLGDILDEPEGRRLMEEMAPELMANPMIEYARRMTLAEGISAAPEIRAVYEAVLKVLNR